MVKVLFVCLGNICRSPLAEGIFKDLVEKNDLTDKISVDSAGTGGWHVGDKPDPRSQQVAREHDIELNSRARELRTTDFNEFDYIIGMDRANIRSINALGEAMAPYKANVKMMREFEGTKGRVKEVEDPYYGGVDGFETAFRVLDACSRNLLEIIKKEHNL